MPKAKRSSRLTCSFRRERQNNKKLAMAYAGPLSEIRNFQVHPPRPSSGLREEELNGHHDLDRA